MNWVRHELAERPEKRPKYEARLWDRDPFLLTFA